MKIDLTYDYILFSIIYLVKISRWHSGRESTCSCRRCKSCRFDPWVGKILWSRKWQPTPVFVPRKFFGQATLVGYSPWGCKELDRTEQLSTNTYTHTHTCRNWVNGSRIHSLCSFHVQSNSSYSRGIRIWSCLGSWCLDNSWRHYQLNKVSDLRDKVKYFKTIVDFKTWIWKLVICILLLF